MKIRPLYDHVLVKRKEEEVSIGGIVIPDNAKEKPAFGDVVAVGSGKMLPNGKRRQPDVKAGDVILFGKFSGKEIETDGEKYLMLREDDIFGVVYN